MKYTRTMLVRAVKQSRTVYDVLRYFGVKLSGGGHSHMTKRIRHFNINTKHFVGRTWNRGRQFPNLRRTAKSILVSKEITTTRLLRRALIESGVRHICAECNHKPTWRGKPLVLEVHHKNGNRLDNRKTNLIFLCPNCHSQTNNYGAKNISAAAGTTRQAGLRNR